MLSVTAEDLKEIAKIKDKLLDCRDEEAVESVFKDSEIYDLALRTQILRQSMQVVEVFDAPSDQPISKEAEYKEELRFFFSGKWKEFV